MVILIFVPELFYVPFSEDDGYRCRRRFVERTPCCVSGGGGGGGAGSGIRHGGVLFSSKVLVRDWRI